jgi:two-component system chemotaxis response regulator CheB
MTRETHVLVAEASPLYRGLFTQAAKHEPGTEVVFANSRDELLQMIRHGAFDAVVIDSEIICPDAADILAEIARLQPRAATLLTTRPSGRDKALQEEISANGKTECLVKLIYGSYSENLENVRQKLAETLLLAREKKRGKEPAGPVQAKGRAKRKRLVLVAASTGGQQALEAVLPDIPEDFPAPILIVLHMPAHSTEIVAASLNRKAALLVKVAKDCERVEPGAVYVAPGGLHMALSSKGNILLEDSEPINGLKPCADALFTSAAYSGAWPEVLAVILTGMGKDGTKGLAELKRRLNCRCIAQSERTCTVYGMPKAAVDAGLADRILDLGDIANSVNTFGFSPLPQGDL